MEGYVQMRYEERVRIEVWHGQGESVREIAGRLSRSPSTVSRELKRIRRAYSALSSEKQAYDRRRQRRRWPKLCDARLRTYVEAGLRARWSPQQIADRMTMEHPDDPTMRVSHETLYTWLYVVPRGGLRRELVAALRQPRAKRRQRRPPVNRDQLRGMISIHERPLEIESRRIPGHWEGDLLVGARGASAIGTLVERHSRFVVLAPMKDKTALSAYEGFTRCLNDIPPELRKTLTYDRGTEMARHADLSRDLQIKVYFADPHSPWQRGTNENTNGLLRQYLPKGMSLSKLTQEDLDTIADEMNARPRKVLGFRTPLEVFTQAKHLIPSKPKLAVPVALGT
ncbi:MAG: IS30 family transposase [Pseudomonadota bacterium]